MVGALLWREYLSPQGAQPLVGAVASEIQDRQEWMGIYAQGEKVGYSVSHITREADGFLVEEKASLRMNLAGMTREVKTSVDLKADSGFSLSSFRMEVTSGAVHFEMAGEMVEGGLSMEIRTAGRSQRHRIPLKEAPWLAQNLRYLLLRSPLEVGRRFQVTLLDPLTLTCQPMEVRVEARESYTMEGRSFPVYRLLYSWNGLQSRAWVTEAGETLREEGFGGFALVKESREEALSKGWAPGKGVDMMRATAVPVKTPLPSPRELSYLKIRFTQADLARFSMQDERQRVRNGEVEVRREDLSRAKTYSLPHPETPELAEALKATPLIQSADPGIRGQVQRILGGEQDAKAAAERIARWVHDELEKVPTVSVPSAVEVLRTRQGDCNEHAVLFAALARAAGIPTKVCAGLLYQDGRFYYHAWNEVYLGKWYSVDTLLGQFPVDATHVKFVEGELESQVQLIPLIGALQAEILHYQ